MLEVGEVVGQRLDDGRVQRAVHAVVRGAQVLGTCWGGVVITGVHHISYSASTLRPRPCRKEAGVVSNMMKCKAWYVHGKLSAGKSRFLKAKLSC